MRQLRRVSLAVVCLLSVGAWAQGAPQVFVSTGTAGHIYSLDTSSGKTKLLVSTSGADYEGMVVGPDNFPGTSHPYLVYACDSNNGKIVRFGYDPVANTAIGFEVVYSNGSLAHPQCGRITSNGDLVVSNKDAGSGLWIFSGITNLELGSGGSQTPTHLATVSGGSQGLAQKNTGDILVVDSSNNKVLKSNFPGLASTSNFITSGLSTPVGIARRSDGFIFVSNQGTNSISRYDAAGLHPSACQSFQKKDTPVFMQTSLDDTLYVAISESNKGFVNAVNGTSCKAIQSFAIPDPAVGIALPPTTATQAVVASKGSALVNFGFAAFDLNNIAGSCGGTISVSLMSPEGIGNLIGLTGVSSAALDPAVNLGLDGFETVFSTKNLTGCAAADGVTNNFQIAGLVSTSVTDPQTVVCDDSNTTCDPTRVELAEIGVWPINGYLPQDITTGGKKTLKCNVFLVNSRPDPTVAGQEPGTFCGFQSPINTTFDSVAGVQNPAAASSFSVGKSIPVKFKLSPGNNGSCHSAPYITDATAILSVAQIADSKGVSTFMPIGLVSNGSSGLGQPLFKGDGNSQYLFNWDSSSCIMPSGVVQACPKGRYSLSIVFLTQNTATSATNPPQSVYTQQTTQVVLK
jgi:hypothetical protein